MGMKKKKLRYDPRQLEPKAERWSAEPRAIMRPNPRPAVSPTHAVAENAAYPSGQLHMGHVATTRSAMHMARTCERATNVLHPRWVGTPRPSRRERRSQHNTPPRECPPQHAAMSGRMQRLGLGYDWSTEVTTCCPEYYR